MAETKQIEPEPHALNPLPASTRAVLRSGPEAVAYHISSAPSTSDVSSLKTTIALPRQSAWTSGLHFHATHTEYLRLAKGAIFVMLNGETKFISALTGGEADASTGRLIHQGLIIEVPRYARHDWGRIEHYLEQIRLLGRIPHQESVRPEDWTEEVVVEEWTDPSNIAKPLFFWNLNGIITAPGDMILSKRQATAKALLGDLWTDLQLFVVFWELDNWPVFNVFRNVSPAPDSYFRSLRLYDAVEVAISFAVLFFAGLAVLPLGFEGSGRETYPRCALGSVQEVTTQLIAEPDYKTHCSASISIRHSKPYTKPAWFTILYLDWFGVRLVV